MVLPSFSYNSKNEEAINTYSDLNSEAYFTDINDRPLIETKASFQPKNGYAIIIGISDYPGGSNDLPWADNDAQEFKSLLINDYNFNPDNIIYLQDSEASESGIDTAFNIIHTEINESDVFVFYYSGHGSGGAGTESLAIYDYPTNSYSETELNNQLDSLNCSENFIFLDTCHSGGFINSIKDSGRYIMTSCEEYEESLSTSEIDNGVFTYYLLQSENLATDSNGDNVISMEEMFDFLYPRVVDYTTEIHDLYPEFEIQHPVEDNGFSKEPVLAPSLGSPNFNAFNNTLQFNFTLYGNGVITNIELFSVLDLYEQNYHSEDITDNATTANGFGLYNGTIEFNESETATAWGVRAEISGNKDISVEYTSAHDNDSDGLDDVFEIYRGLDPTLYDSDYDGLNDYYEYYGFTNALFPDSDLDGLLDGYEVYITHTNPINADSDGDGVSDGIEIENESNPLDPSFSHPLAIELLIIISGIGITIAIIGGSIFTGIRIYKKIKEKRLEKQDMEKGQSWMNKFDSE